MHFELDFTPLILAIPGIKKDLADATLDIAKTNVKLGVAPPLKRPRRDGSTHTPLYHTGLHLYGTLKSYHDKFSFSVQTTFVGANLLYWGGHGVPSRKFLVLNDRLKDAWFKCWKVLGKIV